MNLPTSILTKYLLNFFQTTTGGHILKVRLTYTVLLLCLFALFVGRIAIRSDALLLRTASDDGTVLRAERSPYPLCG